MISNRIGLLCVLTLGLAGIVAPQAGAVTVSCDCRSVWCMDDACYNWGIEVIPHDWTILTRNRVYTPDSSGNEQMNVLAETQMRASNQNNSDQEICTDVSITVTVHENKTVRQSGTAAVHWESSVEASYLVVKGSIGFGATFSATGEYEVETGVAIQSNMGIPDVSLPPHTQACWTVKLYQDRCSVSVVQETKQGHIGDCAVCGVACGWVTPWSDENGSANGFKYSDITIAYNGVWPIIV